MALKTTVLITGCSPSGIGHALAIEFHNRGCHVIATARRPSVLQQLGAMGMSTLQLDVTDQASIDACKETARLTGGRLDNNAGQGFLMPVLGLDLEEVKALFDVNLYSMMRMCKAFASLLMPARGLFIESSFVHAVPAPFASAYSATKSAIVAYSRSLRAELRPFSVRVMIAVIGNVETNIWPSLRDLPPDSLYQPAVSVFHAAHKPDFLLGYAQTDILAARFVTAALRGKGRLGGWIGGSPEWLWEGAGAWAAWLLTALPPWVSDACMDFEFLAGEMTKLIHEAALPKQKTT